MRLVSSLRHALPALVVLLAASTSVGRPNLPLAGWRRSPFTGASLVGNLSKDSADREVFVYLPASYDSRKNHAYPVVYFLHGILAKRQNYVDSLHLPTSIDNAIRDGKLPEMIFVLPDAMTPYSGSMYSNSVTTGDGRPTSPPTLVGYIDTHYRTLAKREARGLAGHSMGGYGTIRIGMKHPRPSRCCMR